MKKKMKQPGYALMLSTVFMLTQSTFAQISISNGGGGAVLPNTSAANANVGISNTTPLLRLHIKTPSTNDGIMVEQTGNTTASLNLNAATGRRWALFSTGTGNAQGSGNFILYDYSGGADRLFVQGQTGNIGIGTVTPAYKLDVNTTVFNDGISITQSNAHAAALHMTNQAGGRHWALFSTGNGNLQGSGNFSIYDYNASADRLFIDGASGNVGIGRITGLNAQLDVLQNKPTSGFARGIYGFGWSSVNATNWNNGIEGGATGHCNSQNFGIRGRAYNGQAYGGFFTAQYNANCTGPAIGVYATGFTHAGFFGGNVHYTGNLTGPSDEMLKTNIQPLTNMLPKIKQLKPSAFLFRKAEFADMQLPSGTQMGLIAQELSTVFPELVHNIKGVHTTNENGEEPMSIPDHKAVNYINLIPVLIAGMQEQQQQIEQLQAQILAMGGRVAPVTGQEVELASIVLNQNVPNPFAESTVISYHIPEQAKNAQLVINNTSGQTIKSIPLTQTGKGSVRVWGNNLNSGIYVYTIVIDGKPAERKQMIKE